METIPIEKNAQETAVLNFMQQNKRTAYAAFEIRGAVPAVAETMLLEVKHMLERMEGKGLLTRVADILPRWKIV